MDNKDKICGCCKQNKPLEHFQKVTKRISYDVGSEDGYMYYVKEMKLCIGCRDVLYATNKRFRKRKY